MTRSNQMVVHLKGDPSGIRCSIRRMGIHVNFREKIPIDEIAFKGGSLCPFFVPKCPI